jgi:Rps23 Pro-64 3,4-dihydroxylase Tpa1-like proline 4-hydroxylase
MEQNDDNYINMRIMILDRDKQNNSFYRVVKQTPKMLYIQKLKSETELIEDDVIKTYEAKISGDFDSKAYKKIKKTSVDNKYKIVYCSIVRYYIE